MAGALTGSRLGAGSRPAGPGRAGDLITGTRGAADR
jgi:hypothetical protein